MRLTEGRRGHRAVAELRQNVDRRGGGASNLCGEVCGTVSRRARSGTVAVSTRPMAMPGTIPKRTTRKVPATAGKSHHGVRRAPGPEEGEELGHEACGRRPRSPQPCPSRLRLTVTECRARLPSIGWFAGTSERGDARPGCMSRQPAFPPTWRPSAWRGSCLFSLQPFVRVWLEGTERHEPGRTTVLSLNDRCRNAL